MKITKYYFVIYSIVGRGRELIDTLQIWIKNINFNNNLSASNHYQVFVPIYAEMFSLSSKSRNFINLLCTSSGILILYFR